MACLRPALISNANTDGTAWMYAVAGHPLDYYDCCNRARAITGSSSGPMAATGERPRVLRPSSPPYPLYLTSTLQGGACRASWTSVVRDIEVVGEDLRRATNGAALPQQLLEGAGMVIG